MAENRNIFEFFSMQKTNAVRILENLKIDFSLVEYLSNENELDALSVARKINEEPESVFKTLVAKGNDKEHYVFCIPGNIELNLKKAALACGNKSVELIKVKELLPLTGYMRGGCSPIGMKKTFKTYIDETALLFDEIFVSAGIRGQQIKLNPHDLLKCISAKFADLI
jgi:Cys-tRNA(Pro)/Cys-tRNA(Cys) deacylase